MLSIAVTLNGRDYRNVLCNYVNDLGVFLFPLRFRFGNKEPGYGQVGDECDLTLVIMTGWERCGPRAVYVGTTYCPGS